MTVVPVCNMSFVIHGGGGGSVCKGDPRLMKAH